MFVILSVSELSENAFRAIEENIFASLTLKLLSKESDNFFNILQSEGNVRHIATVEL